MNENEQSRLECAGYICVNMKQKKIETAAKFESENKGTNDTFFAKREKPVIGKSAIPEEVVRNSPFIIKKIEQAKQRMKDHPFSLNHPIINHHPPQ